MYMWCGCVLHAPLQGASENTVSALQLPPTEVFFRRTESVAVPGFDSMEALFGQDVDTAFPLATNPVLLTGPRSDMFGSSSEVAEADEGGSLRQQSGRLSTSSECIVGSTCAGEICTTHGWLCVTVVWWCDAHV